MHEIGNVAYANQMLDIYGISFERHLNVEAIRHSSSKVVIDYVYAVSGAVLPQILAKFGCDAVVLNASLSQVAPTNSNRETLLSQLGQVVEALKANFGVQVYANGEQLILVDEAGSTIRGEMLTALMAEMMLTQTPRGTIVVPVNASSAVEHIARRHDGRVIRTKANPTALMETCQTSANVVLGGSPRGTIVVPVNASSAVEHIARRHDGRVIRTKANPTALMETCQTSANVVLGGSGEMGFIFPHLHPGFDAMFCIAKIIELLTIQERSLGQIRAELPRISHKTHVVRCPWSTKGSLMRHLVETHPVESLELVDGVKIFDHQHDGWVLILPDAGEPLVHIFANSPDRNWVDETLRDYRIRVQEFVDQEHESEEEVYAESTYSY